jgi:hypothetical protein
MNNNIPISMIQNYFDRLIDKLYKILPMKESNDITLNIYLKSIQNELLGGIELIGDIDYDAKYITILNTIAFLNKNQFDNSTCKREIFKCIRLIRDIQFKIKQKDL